VLHWEELSLALFRVMSTKAWTGIIVAIVVVVALGWGFVHHMQSSSGNQTSGLFDGVAKLLGRAHSTNIDIDAHTIVPVTLRQGFVHGVTYTNGEDLAAAVHLITALKPGIWRLSNYNGVFPFVLNVGQFPERLDTRIIFSLQDVFNQTYGFGVKVSSSCLPGQSNCFPTYEALKSAWLTTTDKVMQALDANDAPVDYFGVFSEPTIGDTALQGVSIDQLLDLFGATATLVRSYRPDAKITAPDTYAYSATGMRALLSYAVDNSIRLDAVSWHELGSPDKIANHVADIRAYMKTVSGLCDPTCPKILIDEYEGSSETLIPGSGVAWLYYLEQAGVDAAQRACWDVLTADGSTTSTCWAGFDGMLLSDNVTPQPLYWVYKTYADLGSTRLVSVSSDANVTALASRNDTTREIHILAGRSGTSGAGGPVTLTIHNYPYQAKSVLVSAIRIPSRGNIASGMATLPEAVTTTASVKNGTIVLPTIDVAVGDAYSITITAH
jgi:hypothetical protein